MCITEGATFMAGYIASCGRGITSTTFSMVTFYKIYLLYLLIYFIYDFKFSFLHWHLGSMESSK